MVVLSAGRMLPIRSHISLPFCLCSIKLILSITLRFSIVFHFRTTIIVSQLFGIVHVKSEHCNWQNVWVRFVKVQEPLKFVPGMRRIFSQR